MDTKHLFHEWLEPSMHFDGQRLGSKTKTARIWTPAVKYSGITGSTDEIGGPLLNVK